MLYNNNRKKGRCDMGFISNLKTRIVLSFLKGQIKPLAKSIVLGAKSINEDVTADQVVGIAEAFVKAQFGLSTPKFIDSALDKAVASLIDRIRDEVVKQLEDRVIEA